MNDDSDSECPGRVSRSCSEIDSDDEGVPPQPPITRRKSPRGAPSPPPLPRAPPVSSAPPRSARIPGRPRMSQTCSFTNGASTRSSEELGLKCKASKSGHGAVLIGCDYCRPGNTIWRCAGCYDGFRTQIKARIIKASRAKSHVGLRPWATRPARRRAVRRAVRAPTAHCIWANPLCRCHG